jgi:hypothetical protein
LQEQWPVTFYGFLFIEMRWGGRGTGAALCTTTFMAGHLARKDDLLVALGLFDDGGMAGREVGDGGLTLIPVAQVFFAVHVNCKYVIPCLIMTATADRGWFYC